MSNSTAATPREIYAGEIARTLRLFFKLTGAEVMETFLILRPPPLTNKELTAECFLTAADIDSVSKLIAETDCNDVIGTYIRLNPVSPRLLPRAHAKFARVRKGTSDPDIVRRRLMLVDFDPKREARKESATNSEKAAAGKCAAACREWLTGQGWAPPIVADSGNGFHLLYPIDLPNDAPSHHQVCSVLNLLRHRFENEAVEVDTSVGNAARLTKLYGTFTRKGTSTDDRPWRRSKLIEIPSEYVD